MGLPLLHHAGTAAGGVPRWASKVGLQKIGMVPLGYGAAFALFLVRVIALAQLRVVFPGVC